MKPKLSKKAIALLRKVQKTITEEPNRLCMGSWGQQSTEDTIKVSDYKSGKWIERPTPACGTVGCIAGWTAILGLPKDELPIIQIKGRDMVDVAEIDDVEEKAAELLGLDAQDAQALFYLNNWDIVKSMGYKSWPKQFDEAYGKAETAEERAKVTCDRIDYFIEHVA
jgi:hypothetical protein